MDSLKIVHWDFKLANALLLNNTVKISDFGFSRFLGFNEHTKSYLGTPITMAPELLDGKEYDSKVDVWAAGICFYMMLFNKAPFKHDNFKEFKNSITKGTFVFNEDCFRNDLLNLIKKMLVVNPNNWLSWNEIKNS